MRGCEEEMGRGRREESGGKGLERSALEVREEEKEMKREED